MLTDFQLRYRSIDDAIPYLELSPEANGQDAPAVLLLHGLGSAKERLLPTMYAFAERGYRTIAPDARLHGERAGADTRDERLQNDYLPTMYEIVGGTTADLSLLLDRLQIRKAALHGISLGGVIAFAALVREMRFQAAAVALGSPDWAGLATHFGVPADHPMLAAMALQSPLTLAAGAYPPRPLLMLHGALDERIPAQGVQALYQRLFPLYGSEDRLKLVIYEGLGHTYTDEMLQQSLMFIERFFPPQRPAA